MRTIQEIVKELDLLRSQQEAILQRIWQLLDERCSLACNNDTISFRDQSLKDFLQGKLKYYRGIVGHLSEKGINTIGDLLEANLSVLDLLLLPKSGKISVTRFRKICREELGYDFRRDYERERKLGYR